MEWLPQLPMLCAIALLAGFVDAVAGGGGLILIPGLMLLLPEAPIAALLGTNKAVAICGTGAAAWQYSRRVAAAWNLVIPSVLGALIAGYLGAATVSHLDERLLRPLVLVILSAVLIWTLTKKEMGRVHAPRWSGSTQIGLGLVVGAAIGFYDGFIGPGTGSFLMLVFVSLFGFSFLNASATAKLVNVVTNLAALAYFLPNGQVIYQAAIPMAACNLVGGILGARLAIRRGNGFVRLVFVLVVGAMMLRLAWETWAA
ncbi:MAG: sulfite exporter TauE/SafE family protein [Panacagrimonas sp.]